MRADDERTGTHRGLPVEQALLLDGVCDAFETEWRAGGRPDIAAAAAELPEPLRATAVRELILLDAFYRRRAGEGPTAAEYTARFPDLDAAWLAGAVAADAEATATGATAETAEARPGTRVGYFGDYELLDEIARGGMGIVYRARQLSLDRTVALKMIRSGEFAGPAEARRFRQEVEAVAALDHPHIVPIHEIGEHTGRAYYTMRLLEGGSLASHIAEFAVAGGSTRGEARFRQTATARLIATVARAVHHAHQRGILHRDLKPSNILLDGKGEPHVVDFGLARRIGSASSLTATGAVLGTPSYMAPEQARGGSDVTTQVDVYGLGAVLYELLTNRPPFKGIDALDTVAQVRERDVTRPRSIAPLIDRDLETICLKCLSKDAARRYGSAEALADDLDRWRDGEPILARRIGRLERARKWARRNPAVSALAAVTAVLILVGVGGAVSLAYSRTLEEKNRQLGEANLEADRLKIDADEQRFKAECEEAESWRRLYFARMHQANGAFQAGNIERVIELLTPYREPTPGKPDLRGFEWHYLWKAARGDLWTIRAHPGGIDAVAYSGDGRTIATGGADGAIRFWNAATGAPEGSIDAGAGICRVTGVEFVPGTTWIAASLAKADGGEVRLWDSRSLQKVGEKRFASRVNGLAVHPDGRHLAAACEDGLVQAWSLQSDRVWNKRHAKAANRVRFSGTGDRLAACGDGGWLPLWVFREDRGLTDEISTGDTNAFLSDRRIDALELSSGGDTLLAAGGLNRDDLHSTGAVFRYDSRIAAGEWSTVGKSESSHYRDIRRLPGSERAATITEQGTVFVHDWAAESPTLFHRFVGHGGAGRAVAVEPAGRFLASVGHGATSDKSGELRVWDMRSYRTPLSVRGSPYHNSSIFPDGESIAAPFFRTGAGPQESDHPYVRVCSATTGSERYRVPSANAGKGVGSTLFSPEGRWVAAALGDEGISICRADTGAEVYRISIKALNRRGGITFSPDGRLIAIYTARSTVEVHDVEKRAFVRQLGSVVGKYSVDFSPDGNRVAFTHHNDTEVIRLADGTIELTIPFKASTAVFSPDGHSIAAAGAEGTAIFSAAGGYRRMFLIRGSKADDSEGRVTSCRYTSDGSRLLTASANGFVRLWDTTSGHELLTLRLPEGAPGTDKLVGAAISPDGHRIAVDGTDGLIRILEPPDAGPVADLDPVELANLLLRDSPLIEDAVDRLKAISGLNPMAREAALRELAKPISRVGRIRSLDRIRSAMWSGWSPAEPVTPAMAEHHLRLAAEYLSAYPGNTDALRERAVALFHTSRHSDALAVLESLAVKDLPVGDVPVEEGMRLAYIAMVYARLGRSDEARRAFDTLEKLRSQNPFWERVAPLGEWYERARIMSALRIGKSDLVMFGGTPARNMVNLVDRNIPDKPDPGDEKALNWKVDLGSLSFGNPVVARGKVFVGTTNSRPRNPRDTMKDPGGNFEPLDKGVLMCFDEATGKFLWQAVHDKGPAHFSELFFFGVSSTPLVEGDRIYYVSNRCTLVCLDVNGFADGNQGIQTEKYRGPTDADFIWELDMFEDLGVFPSDSSMSSPMIVGDLVYVVTSNGGDVDRKSVPKPQAPSFLAVNKKTGVPVWKSRLPGNKIMQVQWSNPAYSDAGGVKQVIFPGGDGWLYSFTADKGELLWKFDANPKDTVYDSGAGAKSDFIGTPVVDGGMLYIGTGRHPEHFTGIAHFYCIDIRKAVENAKKNKDLDVSRELVDKIGKDDEDKPKIIGKKNPDSAVAWHYGGADDREFAPRPFQFGLTMSTACIVDGILYISEFSGCLHCLDAKTGKKFWQYDLNGIIWGSPFYVDGKIYLGATGELFVFRHDKAPKVIDEIDNPQAKNQNEFTGLLKAKRKQVEREYLIAKVEYDGLMPQNTPVVANGVLYVKTGNTLYAFKSSQR